MSPELIDLIKDKDNYSIDISKSNIYSLGIIIL